MPLPTMIEARKACFELTAVSRSATQLLLVLRLEVVDVERRRRIVGVEPCAGRARDLEVLSKRDSIANDSKIVGVHVQGTVANQEAALLLVAGAHRSNEVLRIGPSSGREVVEQPLGSGQVRSRARVDDHTEVRVPARSLAQLIERDDARRFAWQKLF